MNDLVAHYGWWLLALVLIAAEMIAPGYFLLWIGIAAAAVGVIVWFAPAAPALVQAILFAVFAIASCLVYWKFLRPVAERRDDQPLLNRRGAQLVGQRFIVSDAIVNGRGKIRVGDGEWLASGPDMPAGSEVEVVAVDGTTLTVARV